jgi:hypothetical protein
MSDRTVTATLPEVLYERVKITAEASARSVEALRMNNPTIERARRRWVAAGWRPPLVGSAPFTVIGI